MAVVAWLLGREVLNIVMAFLGIGCCIGNSITPGE